MISKNISTVAIAFSALFVGQAFAADVIFDDARDQFVVQPAAQETGKTRAQVKAELAEARQNGVVFDAATDSFVNNAPTQVASKTRDEVKAELAEARRTGNIFDPATDRLLKNA